MRFEMIIELFNEMLPTFISVIAGGLIAIKVNAKSNKKSVFQNFKFDYYVELHRMLFKFATYVVGYSFNEKFEIEESLVISRYLNVEFKFAENIREEFKKAEDNIVHLQIYQSEVKEEIDRIKSTQSYKDENELYSDEKVRSMVREFYSKKEKILEDIMAVKNEVSKEMNKYNK